MNEIENIQDRIDEYIRGTMSHKDRSIFENELRQDADLKHEVEIQTSISDAVQAVHLKLMLQGVEAELTSPKVYWRRFYKWALAAAAIAIVFFFGNWRQTSRIKGFGDDYYAYLMVPSPRDGNSLDSLLVLSYSLIGENNYEEAEKILYEANNLIEVELAYPVKDEETEYNHRLLVLKQFDVQWYQVLIIMRQGKYHKAKMLLKEIARGDGTYSSEAKEILYKMFNVKL